MDSCTAGSCSADLEEALVVSEGVHKEGVESGAPRQQCTQDRPISQHQLPQDVEVVLAWVVGHIHAGTADGPSSGMHLSSRVLTA